MAALIATAAFLSRRLGLRDANGNPSAAAIRLVPPVLLAATLAVALAQTVVVTVLADLGRQFGTTTANATWLLTAFMITSAVATPVAGRLGDQIGHHRVLIAGLLLLIVGSAIAAVSTTHGWYPGAVVGRVAQGLAGGVFPCAYGLARQLLPAAKLPAVAAALSTMFGAGGSLGMVVAGPLSDGLGPTSIFWCVATLAAFALFGAMVIPASPAKPLVARVDLTGSVLLTTTLIALLLTLSQGRTWGWTSPVALAAVGVAGAGAVLFTCAERRTSDPLVDLRLLLGRSLVAANIATVIIGAGMFAAVTLIPLFVQAPESLDYGFHYSATQTGMLIAPMAAAMLFAVPITPVLARAIGSRRVFQLGALLAAAGLLGLASIHHTPVEVACGAAVLGVAYALTFASMGSIVVAASTSEQTGSATGINTILRTVGGAFGAAIGVAIIDRTSDGVHSAPTESGFTVAFLASACITVLAAVMAAAIPPSAGADGTGRSPAPASAERAQRRSARPRRG